MSFALRTLALTVIAAVSVAGLTGVSAQEATPTPTSTITIRFVRDGEAADILTSDPSLIAEGVDCTPGRIPERGRTTFSTRSWPLIHFPDFPDECRKGPPTTIRFEFETEFGLLSVDVLWTGSDIDVNLEVPGPPTDLPPTGSTPAEDPGGSRWFGLGLAMAGLIAASLGAMTWRLGRR